MTTDAEERLIQAALHWDELGQFGPLATEPECCDLCEGQTENREAVDAVKAEREATG